MQASNIRYFLHYRLCFAIFTVFQNTRYAALLISFKSNSVIIPVPIFLESPMTIAITYATESTVIIGLVLLAVFALSFRKTERDDLLTVSVSQELKGLGILAIVFAHISYMLVSDSKLLYPLNKGAGVGVDLFLFLSGYGLSVSMLKKPLSAMEFYKRRLIKVMIPFWLVLLSLFVADAVFLDIHYSFTYMVQSFLGWFPFTRPYQDVNSPFWYITWMLMFYALFPLLFNKQRLWLTAVVLSITANLITGFNLFKLDTNWWQQMHTDAFSLGVLLAWLLHETDGVKSFLVKRLTQLRDEFGGVGRILFMLTLLVFAAYLAAHNEPWNWPKVSQLLKNVSVISDVHVIGETTSLLAMIALLIVFTMKKLDSRFLAVFGAYSYEAYLLHWPLMARYDIYFHALPAWCAVLLWLLTLLAIGWLLQKFSQSVGAWVDSIW